MAPLSANPTIDETIAHSQALQLLSFISPDSISQQATAVILNPGITAFDKSGWGRGVTFPQQRD